MAIPEITIKEKYEIKNKLYLNSRTRSNSLINTFTSEQEKWLKYNFLRLYGQIIKQRGKRDVVFNEKEEKVMDSIFLWMIGSPKFNGDLMKGIYLVSGQGFGKDIILSAVVAFFANFQKHIKEFTFDQFNKLWFEKGGHMLSMPIKINDINEKGIMKRERTAIPFLELMDTREQFGNRRGLLVSSNYGPERVQQFIEKDSPNPRVFERAKECFNILKVTETKSKRIENIITF